MKAIDWAGFPINPWYEPKVWALFYRWFRMVLERAAKESELGAHTCRSKGLLRTNCTSRNCACFNNLLSLQPQRSPSLSLELQRAQSRSFLFASGPNVHMTHVLGALGYAKISILERDCLST